jgi:hypothetical protein
MKNKNLILKLTLASILFVVSLAVSVQTVSSYLSSTADFESSRQSIAVLEQKIQALSSIPPQVVDSSDLLVGALPAKDSSLLVFSQIRSMAAEKGVNVKSLATSTIKDQTSEIYSTQLSFVAEATQPNLIGFLLEIPSIAPKTHVDSVTMTSSGVGNALAQVSLRSFWSPLPETISAITSSLEPLTDLEQQQIVNYSSLRLPIFTEESIEQIPASPRDNPFEETPGVQTVIIESSPSPSPTATGSATTQ